MAMNSAPPGPPGAAPFSLGRIVLAAVLIGGGVLLMSLWLVTVTANWVYFLGVLPMALGMWLLFRPTTSPPPAGAAAH